MKKSKEKFETLCVVCEFETERYKQMYEALRMEKNKAIENIKTNYLPDTTLYREKLDEVENKFQTEVAELKADYSTSIGQAIDNVREEELARVQTVNETRISKIKAISDIPMSSDELLALAERYDVENDYWCSRLLCNIAESNGIDGFESFTEASYSLKCDILNQMADQAAEMIRDYDGTYQKNADARQRTMYILLSKSVLNRCRELWNGENNFIDAEEAVSKAYLTVYSKRTDIEKGLAIGNILKNAKGERRNLLLCKFAEDSSISDFAFKLSGHGTELLEFRNGKSAEYMKAKLIVEEIAMTKDEEKRKELVATNSDNSFLNGIIEVESKRNKIFKEFVGEKEESDS